jgi:hypothetical protein
MEKDNTYPDVASIGNLIGYLIPQKNLKRNVKEKRKILNTSHF